MKTRKRAIYRALLALMLLSFGGRLCAASADTNFSIRCQRVKMARQGRIESLSILDGRLCYRMDGLMYATPISTYGAEGVDVAADLMAIDDKMTYVVRHPATGMLYYTKPNKEGVSQLYMHVPTARRNKDVRVMLGEYAGMVCHPTFTADGSIMVFSAAIDTSGSMELFYSSREAGRWSHPKSLGSTVNSSADDVNPYISGEYLYFGSNRGSSDSSRYALYMCRLVSTSKIQNDTIFSYPIGKGKVQKLPMPFSDDRAKPSVVYDARRQCGFWVRRALREGTPDELYVFRGDVTGTYLQGTVRGSMLQPDGSHSAATALPAVHIAVYDMAQSAAIPLFHGYSDAQGRYSFYLQPDRRYRLLYSKEGYSDYADTLVTEHGNGDVVYEPRQKDVQLVGLRYHVDYVFDNHHAERSLFRTETGEVVSAAGLQRLQYIVRYLADNPDTYLYLTMVYTEGSEAFNRLLATQRVQAVRQALWQEGVENVTLLRAVYEPVVSSNGELEELSNAVLFFFSDKPIVEDRDKQGRSLHYFLQQEEREEELPAVRQWDASMMNRNQAQESAGEAPQADEDTAGEEEDEEPSEINPLFRQALENE